MQRTLSPDFSWAITYCTVQVKVFYCVLRNYRPNLATYVKMCNVLSDTFAEFSVNVHSTVAYQFKNLLFYGLTKTSYICSVTSFCLFNLISLFTIQHDFAHDELSTIFALFLDSAISFLKQLLTFHDKCVLGTTCKASA